VQVIEQEDWTFWKEEGAGAGAGAEGGGGGGGGRGTDLLIIKQIKAEVDKVQWPLSPVISDPPPLRSHQQISRKVRTEGSITVSHTPSQSRPPMRPPSGRTPQSTVPTRSPESGHFQVIELPTYLPTYLLIILITCC